MNRHFSSLILLSLIVSTARFSHAEDLSKRWGISGIAQAAFPLGVESVREQGDVGTDLGGMLRYGLSSHWGLGLGYENIDLQEGIRVEPITLSGIYSFFPEKVWTPTAQVGLGTAASNPNGRFNNLSAKAALGLDYFINHNIALGPQVNYTYVSESGDAPRQVHALGVGLIASYFFGGSGEPTPVQKTVAPVSEPAKAAPPSVSVAVNPAAATLGPSQTQAFTASVAGTGNQQVTWSLAPALGALTPNGQYTAPAAIALAETVNVTATSVADPSKSASARVQLTPPASAPQQVSIELKVLFDTGKDVIKPEYSGEIKNVADFMKSYPSAKAEIEGHTDNVGSKALNMGLSQRRADSVRNYLINQFGIDASRLTAKGYGPDKPVADNQTVEGRAKNRRVIATFQAAKS